MLAKSLLISSLAAAVAAEDHVLGVYIFHRHGDRTTKSWTPVKLTSLGADEAFSSGSFFRNRYVQNGAAFQVAGIQPETALLSQLSVTSPKDAVLHNSAVAFLQGLYPPTAATAETLANNTKVTSPLQGYQYIPVDAVEQAATASKAESNAWLQGNSGCPKAVSSSNSYLSSDGFNKDVADSKDFYQSLLPAIQTTFNSGNATFKNAYTIFDYLNVAQIHNQTYPGQDLVNKTETFNRLYSLASTHEWNLAYSEAEPVRAIAGAVLAGQALSALTDLANKKKGATTFNIQFGAYGTFMSFFGLAQLQKADPKFYGICDYASAMVLELVAPSADAKKEDMSVRFLFANGTAAQNELTQYPLFGKTALSWNDFQTGMNKIAVSDTASWCNACGNPAAQCSANSTDSSVSASSSSSDSGVSRPVAGVIGALVTLVVILGVQALVMVAGGMRLVKKSTLAQAQQNSAAAAGKA